MHIAVIDEADSIQDMLRSVLESSGHQIETYRTMPDAITHYDLIIVEPGEDSQELVRLLPLRSSHALSVLILTFHEANLTLARRHLLPVLWKMPFRLSALLAMIEQFGSKGTHNQ
jgi:DNA-binding response OmpR family regulator